MKITRELLKIIDNTKEYEEKQLENLEFLNQLLKNKKSEELEEIGKKMFEHYLSLHPEHFVDFQDAFVSFYKIFTYFMKEEGIGIVKSIELRSGYMKLAENLPLPCDIFIGVIKAVFKKLKAKALNIKHLKCKKDGLKFCEYEITWMFSHVK